MFERMIVAEMHGKDLEEKKRIRDFAFIGKNERKTDVWQGGGC